MQGRSDPNRELLDAAALCRQLVPDGSVEAFLADHRVELFPDGMFEDLFPSKRGRPSIEGSVVASVMVLQALEGLSDRYRDGYKAHAAVEPETGIITNATLTPANVGDGPTGAALFEGEQPGLQVLADSAYGSGEVRAGLSKAKHRQAIKPIPLRPAVPGGFDRDAFKIDHAARTATCPAGHTVAIRASGGAYFDQLCDGCPLRQQCTNARDGRHLTIHRHDIELVEARRAWRDGDFADDYRRWRPMVERGIAWLVTGSNRRVRYRGVARNNEWLKLRVAALNLRRLINLGLRNDNGWAIA